jgi:integrase
MKLSAVKPLNVTEYFAQKSEYSHSFLKRSKFLLNAAFEAAIDNDLADRNPVRRAEVVRKVQPEKEPFTEDEARTIIDFAKTDEHFGVPMFIMLNSGIRSGEMRGMSVEQLDLENGVITVDRAVKHTVELGSLKMVKLAVYRLNPKLRSSCEQNSVEHQATSSEVATTSAGWGLEVATFTSSIG